MKNLVKGKIDEDSKCFLNDISSANMLRSAGQGGSEARREEGHIATWTEVMEGRRALDFSFEPRAQGKCVKTSSLITLPSLLPKNTHANLYFSTVWMVETHQCHAQRQHRGRDECPRRERSPDELSLHTKRLSDNNRDGCKNCGIMAARHSITNTFNTKEERDSTQKKTKKGIRNFVIFLFIFISKMRFFLFFLTEKIISVVTCW